MLSTTHLILCRAGFEAPLAAECEAHGIVQPVVRPESVQIPNHLPDTPLLFERQRLPDATLIPTAALKPFDEALARRVWERGMPELLPWALHIYASEQEGETLDKRLPGLERLLRKAGKQLHANLARFERKPEKLFRQSKGSLVQAFLTSEGLWISFSEPRKLTATVPGGRYRMRMDPDAPSRSFLKMEEALSRFHFQPEAGERVIDLGAAPGGWTWSFLKRGCQVTAIDNGPLKLPPVADGQLEALRVDGMTFRLPTGQAAIDWLVGDMLIPPGKAFSLLRYWVGQNRARRIVMNIKLPQTEPVPALLPVCDWLQSQKQWKLQIRQLYHDRREVTVFGYREET